MSGDARTNSQTQQALQDALVVLKVLEEAGYAARMAGGCVRDRLLHKPPVDFDVATDAVPEQVMALFESKQFRVIPTGLLHGTVSVLLPSGPIEVTTLRRDVATDGRRAKVEFGTSFEEDAARRDFTMNAMFEDRNGKIYDFFNGREHLQQRELHFVGTPTKRIREDYLRILRFFRFWARFELKPDPAAITAIRDEREGLSIVSQERITMEILLLLATDHPAAALKAMDETGVRVKIIAPEPWNDEVLTAVDRLSCLLPEWRALARLAHLLPHSWTKNAVQEFAEELRLSKKQSQQLATLARAVDSSIGLDATPAEYMHLIDQIEHTLGDGTLLMVAVPAWEITRPSTQAILKKLRQIEIQKGVLRKLPLPLTGKDITQSLRVKPGVIIGEILERLKTDFRNEQWRTKDQGLKLARRYYEKF